MSDFQLKNGSEVDFDLDAFTYGEYESFRLGTMSETSDAEFMARVTGLSVDEIKAIKYREWRKLVRAFFRKAMGPLDDPN